MQLVCPLFSNYSSPPGGFLPLPPDSTSFFGISPNLKAIISSTEKLVPVETEIYEAAQVTIDQQFFHVRWSRNGLAAETENHGAAQEPTALLGCIAGTDHLFLVCFIDFGRRSLSEDVRTWSLCLICFYLLHYRFLVTFYRRRSSQLFHLPLSASAFGVSDFNTPLLKVLEQRENQ